MTDIDFMPNLKSSNTYTKCLLSGKQSMVPKLINGIMREETVHICLALIRLPVVGTDLLLTLNSPMNSTQVYNKALYKFFFNHISTMYSVNYIVLIYPIMYCF
jgi:hypothetical protein